MLADPVEKCREMSGGAPSFQAVSFEFSLATCRGLETDGRAPRRHKISPRRTGTPPSLNVRGSGIFSGRFELLTHCTKPQKPTEHTYENMVGGG